MPGITPRFPCIDGAGFRGPLRKSDFFSKFASPGVARISEGFCRDSAIGALRKLETGGILIVGIFWDHFFRGRGPVTSDTSGSRIRSEPASITGRDDMGHTADDPTGPTRRAVASNSLPAQPIGEGDPPEGCRRVQTRRNEFPPPRSGRDRERLTPNEFGRITVSCSRHVP